MFDRVHAMFSMKTALLHLHCSEPLVWEPLHPNYASSKGHVDCSWLHITYVQQIRVNAVCFERLPFFVSYASGSPAVCMMLPKTACLAPSVNSSLCNRHMGAFIHSYACPFLFPFSFPVALPLALGTLPISLGILPVYLGTLPLSLGTLPLSLGSKITVICCCI